MTKRDKRRRRAHLRALRLAPRSSAEWEAGIKARINSSVMDQAATELAIWGNVAVEVRPDGTARVLREEDVS